MGDRSARKKILVVCGGKSSEREVSLASTSAILKHLDPKKYDVRVAVIDPKGRWTLPSDTRRAGLDWEGPSSGGKNVLTMDPASGFALTMRTGSHGGRVPDVVFPVLHGPNGEDGTIQGLFEVAGIPYVGCGVLGSALSMDKEYPKRLATAEGVDILPYAIIRSKRVESPQRRGSRREKPRGYAFLAKELGLPVFVKPARQGSSVGITKVERASGLAGAIRLAQRYDEKVIVEKGIDAREIEVAVLGDGVEAEASVCGEIRVREGFYDYSSKYDDPNAAQLLIPAPVPRRLADKARAWAVRMFQVLDCDGMARVDFLLNKKTGRLYFNEVNTIPGFTSISMYPKLWEASGLPFTRLLDRLIELALRRHRRRSRLKTTR